MNRTEIVKRIVDYLVFKKDYKMVKLDQDFNDFWLINTTSKLQLIRVSFDGGSNEHIDSVSTLITGLFGTNTPLIQIVVTDTFGKQDEDLLHYVNSEKSSFEKIKQYFPGIDTILDSKYKTHSEKSKKSGKLTIPIIVICVIMYVLQLYFNDKYGRDISILLNGAIYKSLIYGAHEWWRLLTSGFVHLGYQHVLFNLLAFSSVTPLVERIFGTKKTLIILLVSIIVGSWTSLLSLPQLAVGAGLSGGIYGLLAALIVYLFKSRLIFLKDVNRQIIMTIGLNLLISFFPNVSFMAHLGGAAAGLLLGLLFLSDTNKTLKKSLQISIVMLFVFLGVFSLNYDNKTQLNKDVINLNNAYTKYALPDIGLSGIGQYLDGQLQRYYEREGY